MEKQETSFGLVWWDRCIDGLLWISLFRSRVGHLDETWGRGRKQEEQALSSACAGDAWHRRSMHCLDHDLLLFSRSVVSNSLEPMDYSTPGFPVLHHLPEFAPTHVHWVDEGTHCNSYQNLSKLIEWWHHFSRFVPSFLRLGSWNIIMFVCFEQLKRELMKSRQTMDCAT